ncbi:Gfo/Idh/MocA family protein [Paenarthrobacter sp. NPDC092416]|uniref:Gfo/Idh/MocA family protein n=1 Tax=Paenarthrobacter sp. NPDC092416 TaxID=3364386 RepID=UPI00381D4777
MLSTSHRRTKLALLAGKHVLCEKPMALSEDEAREMVQLAAGRRLILAVNHRLPHNAVHRKVREIVSSGRIGTVLAAQVSNTGLLHERLRGWRISEPRMGPGVILDLTSHDASVLNPLLGMPLSVTCLAAAQAEWNSGEGTDSAVTLIEYRTEKGNRVFAQTIDSFALPHA